MKTSLLALCLALWAATPSQAGEPDNLAVARAMVDAINARRLEDLDRWVAPGVIRHSAATPGVAVESLEDFKTFLAADFIAVPDSVMEVQRLFGSGDWVALQGRYSGTQAGPMGPFPPTNRRFELWYIAILRFEEGRVAEIWIEWDNLGILAQLGHIPSPAD